MRMRLSSYVKKGRLVNVYRGFYAKDNDYNVLELANKIYTPSYVSFETVLTREGVNFQYYSTIFLASYITRRICIKNQNIQYIRIKDYVLTNKKGVNINDIVSIANKERAFLDRLYVSKNYWFDVLDGLNWDLVFEILPIYHSKRLEKEVKKYYDYYIQNK
jgi:predicted transcriptional regulator of viral defense system